MSTDVDRWIGRNVTLGRTAWTVDDADCHRVRGQLPTDVPATPLGEETEVGLTLSRTGDCFLGACSFAVLAVPLEAGAPRNIKAQVSGVLCAPSPILAGTGGPVKKRSNVYMAHRRQTVNLHQPRSSHPTPAHQFGETSAKQATAQQGSVEAAQTHVGRST
eukprot:7890292-Pyramimonas_sp.AAC.2